MLMGFSYLSFAPLRQSKTIRLLWGGRGEFTRKLVFPVIIAPTGGGGGGETSVFVDKNKEISVKIPDGVLT